MTMDQLAIHGGKPVRKDFLPYARQWIDSDDIEAVSAVLRSDFLTTGPKVKEFEQKIASTVGAKYAVSFINGTAALHAACFAAGIKKGDEVITTPLSFAATANSILYQGATPVFADIDQHSFNLSPESIEPLINERTKAIIPVDFAGQPCDYDNILPLAQKYNLTVIEDAAHALGATYKGKSVGAMSDMTMFSFHPVKHITTGEGGMITTNDEKLYNELIQFRNHGITKDPKRFIKSDGPWFYEMQFLGYNYRLNDLQAALGLSQLSKLESFIERRKQIVEFYNNAFSNIAAIHTPKLLEGCESSWHLYVLRLDLDKLTVSRKKIFEALQKENIGVNVHYIPIYWHPYYENLGYEKGLCPTAEQTYEEIITLPLFPQMTNDDASDVVKAVNKVISYYSL